MKHFAIYLPVEGEIEMKDIKYPLMVWTPRDYHRGYIANHEHTEDDVMVIYNMEEEGFYARRELKRLKLFLCSRNIQVGDRVWNDAVNLECGIAEELHDDTSLDCVKESGEHFMCISRDDSGKVTGVGDVPTKQLFQVIGEISPDATWVKEGDEFNEEDIKCVPRGIRIETTKNSDGTYNATYEFNKSIRIKGPCGHFH